MDHVSSVEELMLEEALFGDLKSESLIEKLTARIIDPFAVVDKEQDDGDEEENDIGFVIDTLPDQEAVPNAADDSPDLHDSGSSGSDAVWHDADDEQLEVDLMSQNRLRKLRTSEDEQILDGTVYQQRLRSQFERLFPRPRWAEDKTSDAADSLFSQTNSLVTKHSSILMPGTLDISRQRDANSSEHSESIITALQWHPNAQVLFTAGFDKTLRLFHIDGRQNTKLQSVHFKDTPIYNAQWLPRQNGGAANEIVVSGRRKYFFVYNVDRNSVTRVPFVRGRDEKSWESFKVSPCGKFIAFMGNDGEVILVNAKDKQMIGSCRMNGTVRCIDFSHDGTTMFSSGSEGTVYQWDMRSYGKCVQTFADQGALSSTALTLSKDFDNSYLASADVSGVVNIYKTRNGILSQRSDTASPAPFKSLTNLTTKIDKIQFNCDAQLMAFSSKIKKDQMRLVHLPTGQVYSNWPAVGTTGMSLGYVQTFDFSPNGGQVAVGNDKGKVLLYKLNKYPQT